MEAPGELANSPTSKKPKIDQKACTCACACMHIDRPEGLHMHMCVHGYGMCMHLPDGAPRAHVERDRVARHASEERSVGVVELEVRREERERDAEEEHEQKQEREHAHLG